MLKLFDLEESYSRFPEIKREEVVQLQEWIKAQPHLPDLPEEEALLFFFACRYSMEFSKEVIDRNLTYRTHIDELFVNLDVESPEFKRAMNTLAICTLPKATPEGYRVIMSKLIDTDASNYNYADSIKLYYLIHELWVREDGIRPGDIIVFDFKGVTLGHVSRIGLLQMKNFLLYLQDAIALRLVGVHFINSVPFIDKIVALMNPFMKKDLQGILHLHYSLEDFYKFVPKEILPQDYNGPEMEMINLREVSYGKLRENRNEIMEYERLHQVNEKLRPGEPKNASNLFGIAENFKTLI